jgi:hypothetical protein
MVYTPARGCCYFSGEDMGFLWALMSAQSAIIPRFMKIIKEEKSYFRLLFWSLAAEGPMCFDI